jgi:hypothetical protein
VLDGPFPALLSPFFGSLVWVSLCTLALVSGLAWLALAKVRSKILPVSSLVDTPHAALEGSFVTERLVDVWLVLMKRLGG